MTKPTLLPTATRMTTLDRLHPIAADASRGNGPTSRNTCSTRAHDDLWLGTELMTPDPMRWLHPAALHGSWPY